MLTLYAVTPCSFFTNICPPHLSILPVNSCHGVPAALCEICNRKGWRTWLVYAQMSIRGKASEHKIPEPTERLLSMPVYFQSTKQHFWPLFHPQTLRKQRHQETAGPVVQIFHCWGLENGAVNAWACPFSLRICIQSLQYCFDIALTYPCSYLTLEG